MKHSASALCALALVVLITTIASAESTLRPWEKNAWYWSHDGEPVLLLGGSDDDNLFQWPEKQLISQLDRLAAAGGNVIRNTMSDRNDKGFEVYPFRQLDGGKYDLNAWNGEYWTRFERMLRETARRKIFVQIEIWDRFDYSDNGGRDRWQFQPYNPINNVNYTHDASGLARRYNKHPGANEQPFFFTTPEQQNNQVVLRYQQRFVGKLLDHSLKYGHVLYCMDNETKGEEAWGRYWSKFIKQRAVNEGKQAYTTEMWDDWDLTSDQHKRTFDHPELYAFVDVSQNNHNKGQKHWDRFLSVRTGLSRQPRPMNTTKTYGASTGTYGTDQDGIERFWRHLLAGAASARFHRPNSGLGLGDKAVATLRAARRMESLIPLWSVKPANKLLSNRSPNEAYLAARPGHSYALYFPAGGAVGLDLSAAKGPMVAQWINIANGRFGPKQMLDGGKRVTITPPSKANWAVAIVKR